MRFFVYLWRLAVMACAYTLACLGAAVVFTIATQRRWPDIALNDGSLLLWLGVVIITGLLIAKIVAPALIGLIMAEAFHWRSVWLYLALGLGCAALADIWILGDMFDPDPSPTRAVLAAGTVGAFLYWLIAGRRAGAATKPLMPTDRGSA